MSDDDLNLTFAALADPTRRAILARLRKGEASVNDIAEPFLARMTLPAVTKHLKVLEKAGLITKTRDAQYRPCKLNPTPLIHAAGWMDDYRQHMEDALDRLGDYLKTMSAPPDATVTPIATHHPKRKPSHDRHR